MVFKFAKVILKIVQIWVLNIVPIIYVNCAVKICSQENLAIFMIVSNNFLDINWKNCIILKKLKILIEVKLWDYIPEDWLEDIN